MLDTILKNIREALTGPKNNATDSYVQLQVLLGEREIQKQKSKYKAAELKVEEERTQDTREEDKYKGVF